MEPFSKNLKIAFSQALRMNERLQIASYCYHNNKKSIMCDEEYDEQFNALKQFEQQHPEIFDSNNPIGCWYEKSITQQIGFNPLPYLKKVKHREPMLSLANIFSTNDLPKHFPDIKKNPVLVNPKFDGIACSIVYEKQILTIGATRGDGSEGEDITEVVKCILNVPKQLHSSIKDLEVRGELMFTRKAFKAVNLYLIEKGLPPYSNARNAVSGVVRSLNPDPELLKHLSFFAYDLRTEMDLDSHQWFKDGLDLFRLSYAFKFLNTLGFTTKRYKVAYSYNDVGRFIDDMNEIRLDNYDVDTDGVVIQYDHLEMRKALGSSMTSPNWAVAFKYPAQRCNAILEDVEWQIGRTGVITPVAHIDAMGALIGGVEYTSVTLHNCAEIKRLGIKINDTVIVARQGDVIPKIIGNILENRIEGEYYGEILPPKECPACGSATIMSSDEAFVYCPNTNGCKDRLKAAIEHFCSREAMNIRGLGEGIIKTLIGKAYIGNISDIYRLSEDKEKLSNEEGFGSRSVEKILEAIEESKKNDLYRSIYGVGIPHVGVVTARTLANHYRSWNKLIHATIEELEKLDGVGSIVATSIFDWVNQEENLSLIGDLSNLGVNDKRIDDGTTNKLAGQRLVFSGSFIHFTRPEYENMVRLNGGVVGEGVSKNVTALIKGDGGGSKMDKAIKLNVPVLTEEQFLTEIMSLSIPH